MDEIMIERHKINEFFNIENPFVPKVLIEFKVGKVNNKTIWQPIITGKGNNLFQKLTITDTTGFPSVELELFDKDFSFLESIIVRTMMYRNYRNVASKKGENILTATDKENKQTIGVAKYIYNDDEPGGEGSGSDFRIKIGYYVNKANAKDWKLRASDDLANSKETYFETDWMYFYILNMPTSLGDIGYNVKISGMSLGSASLNINVLQEYSVIHGTPKQIINIFNNHFFYKDEKNPFTKWECVLKEEPDGFIGENKDISISLGEKQEEGKFATKSLISILNDFVSQVAPRYIDKDEKIITSTDIKNGAKIAYTLSYYYSIEKDSSGKVSINFLYHSIPGKQKHVRVYKVRSQDSIVKSFNTTENQEYYALNFNYFVKGADGDIYIGKNYQCSDNVDPIVDYSNIKSPQSGVTTDMIKANGIFETFPVVYVKEFISTGLSTDEATVLGNVNSSINKEMVFEATIEIPGDPFYFFNENIQPYVYEIELVVPRPVLKMNQNTNDNEKYNIFNYTVDSVLYEKSHYSGLYLLKGITHVIDRNGFSTTLQMMKDWSK